MRFSVDSLAGYRHHADALVSEQRARDEQRLRWRRFAAQWFHIGAAISNGYGPGAHALVIDPPAHPPVSAAASPVDGAPDLAGACAGGGIVVGRIAPEILTGEALAATLALPDLALLTWADGNAGRAVLSERERHHARVLRARRLDLRDMAQARARHTRTAETIEADAIANAAAFVRSLLRGGSDHHVRRLRFAVEAARLEAGPYQDDGIDAMLDQLAAERAVVLDGLRYVVMSIAIGAREARLAGPRRSPSTLRPVAGTPTWLHTTGSDRKPRYRWYRRLANGQFIAEPRP